MNPQNPLDKLRNIHLPDDISLWPPAPGWWILLLLIICLLIWTIWVLWKKHQQKRLFRLSIASVNALELAFDKHQDSLLLVKQYSSLIRRIALARFPRQQIASLTGKSWLTFLDKSAGMNLFNSEAGKLLINGPYQKTDKSIQHIDELKLAIHHWIKAVNLQKQTQALTDVSGEPS